LSDKKKYVIISHNDEKGCKMSDTALKTDKYEFTMLQSALQSGVANKRAVFELFNRKLPNGRTYGIVAGTARAIEAIQDFHFDENDINFLADHLNEETIDYLRNFKFTGSVYGYAEGDMFFPYSPVITIDATFAEAVLFETILLSIMNYDCAVASAASRLRVAAKNIPLQELGARRVNEDAAVVAARAAYIAGWNGTSNILAAERYGVPVFGTSAHAFTLAHQYEKDAFKAQVEALGVGTTLLIDTYDIVQGIHNAVEVAGPELGAIRIDSGDPMVEIPAARKLLDELGAPDTRIIFSGDLDYDMVVQIAEANLPVDGFGIGSAVVTGDGYPNCGFVYKLVAMEYDDGELHPVAKKATGKSSVGGRKTVYRNTDEDWKVTEEHMFIAEPTADDIAGMTTVQHSYIVNGWLVRMDDIETARETHAQNITSLPEKTVEVVFH
jgi:nicotinate phosphoribosyltransferase